MNRWLLSCLAAALLLCGCLARRPEGVMSPRKMENFLYDYHLAQSVAVSLPYNERYKRELYYNYVFEKHGLSRDDFNKSVVWYTRHPDELNKIYTRLYNRIDDDSKLLTTALERTERKSYRVVSGDTVDLWYLPHVQFMTESPLLNPLLFEFSADTTFHESDSLSWRMDLTFFGIQSDSITPSAYMSLSVFYGDSVSAIDTLARMSGSYELAIQCDPVKIPQKVKGAVTYMGGVENDSLFLLLSGVSLIRTHVYAAMADSLASDTVAAGVPAEL